MNRSIAYLTSFYARAGDTFIRREVEELRRRGWTVHTFSIRRADEGGHAAEDVLREQRTTEYLLERGPWRLAGAFLWMAARHPVRMSRAVRQARALRWPGLRSWAWHGIYLLEASYLASRLLDLEVALLHDHISMNSATVAMLAATLAGIPFSMTVHGPHDFLAAEHWALGRKIAGSALSVCISDFGRSQCMLFTPPEHWAKLHVVRCGVDGPFLRDEPAPAPARARLVSIGRLNPEKGQVLLAEAAARLRDQGIDVEIVLVGDGPARAQIERRAREGGVEDRLRLVGWQSSDEVRAWILGSRAVVVSSFAEGIPVVLLEAMALRRPAIATCVGGIPELVRPGENGWLVPAGSAEELARAMREAVTAPEEQLRRMGERGRQLVLERHDLAAGVGELAALFERVLGPG